MRTNIQSPLALTAAGAIAEEVLRACVHCGMCNATCPTYQLTGDELDGPRGRIYLIKGVLEGEPVGALTQTHLDRCLSCRACETTCPSGVQYHRLLDVGREVVSERAERPWRQRLARAAIRTISRRPGPMIALVALGRAFQPLLPADLREKLPARPPILARPTRVQPRRMSLLGGCVQAAVAPHFNDATARVFDRIGIALKETSGVGCCGAVSFHLDAPDEARALARKNIDAWIADLEAGAEALIVNASGCAAFIRDYPDILAADPVYADRARRVVEALADPVVVLEQTPPRVQRAPVQPRIAVHDPCTLRNGPGLEGVVSRLLRGLGYDPQTAAETPLCCGSAGAYSILQPNLSRRLRTAKLTALTASAPAAIYTANIGCWMHMGGVSSVPVRHWIEAVDEVTAV